MSGVNNWVLLNSLSIKVSSYYRGWEGVNPAFGRNPFDARRVLGFVNSWCSVATSTFLVYRSVRNNIGHGHGVSCPFVVRLTNMAGNDLEGAKLLTLS